MGAMRGGYCLVRNGWIGLVAFVVLAVLPISRTHAADRQTVADVHCVVVAMHMATLSTPRQRSAGVMIATYYLGRLDGRSPHLDIERLIEEEAKKMTPTQLQSDAVRCGRALREKGQEMVRISADLSKGAPGLTKK